MKQTNLTLLALAAATFSLGGAAFAQAPGGGAPGGFQPTPEMMAAFKKMQAWRDNHKSISQLSQTMRAIVDMDKEPATKLTKDQAKKMWAAIGPWQSKPVMTDDQARDVLKQVTAPLSTTQLKKYAALQAKWRSVEVGAASAAAVVPAAVALRAAGLLVGAVAVVRRGGGGGGRNFDPSKMQMKEYNPLNVSSYPDFMKERGGKRTTEFLTLLKSRAA